MDGVQVRQQRTRARYNLGGVMKHISLFTGGGGGEYAALLLGWHTIAYCEIEDYPYEVIKARIRDGIFPNAPVYRARESIAICLLRCWGKCA